MSRSLQGDPRNSIVVVLITLPIFLVWGLITWTDPFSIAERVLELDESAKTLNVYKRDPAEPGCACASEAASFRKPSLFL